MRPSAQCQPGAPSVTGMYQDNGPAATQSTARSHHPHAQGAIGRRGRGRGRGARGGCRCGSHCVAAAAEALGKGQEHVGSVGNVGGGGGDEGTSIQIRSPVRRCLRSTNE